MPIHKQGSGYQWGGHGKVYHGPGAREKAGKQAAAAHANGYKGMAKGGIVDFKDFKKVHDAEDHCILQHPMGHEIKIAKNALSKPLRKQMDELPLCSGGMVKGYSDGGQVDQDPPETQPTPVLGAGRKGYADGGPVGAPSDPSQLPGGADEAAAIQHPPLENLISAIGDKIRSSDFAKWITDGKSAQSQTPAPASTPTDSQPAPTNFAQEMPSATPTQGMPGATMAPPQDPMQAYADALQGGANESKAGLFQQAAAEGAQGQAQSQALDQNTAQLQHYQQQYQQHFDDLNAERQSFIGDIQNGQIDANKFINSMSTGSKIKTGIGLILGGMGAGMTGGNNMALQFLQHQIDNDIDAQKANLGSKQNLLQANLRQYGNLRDATDMTRVMLTDMVSNQLKSEAARAAGPLAKAQALQHAGALDMQVGPQLAQMAARRAIFSGMQNPQAGQNPLGNAAVLPPEEQKSYFERYLPGAGTFALTKDDADAIKKQEPKMDEYGRILFQLRDMSQKAGMGGTWNPTDVAAARTLAKKGQDLYRQMNGEGVFRKGESEFINGIVGGKPDQMFSNIRFLPALNQELASYARERGEFYRSRGVNAPPLRVSMPNNNVPANYRRRP